MQSGVMTVMTATGNRFVTKTSLTNQATIQLLLAWLTQHVLEVWTNTPVHQSVAQVTDRSRATKTSALGSFPKP